LTVTPDHFVAGTRDPVRFRFTKVDPQYSAHFTLQVFDLAGGGIVIDPVMATVRVGDAGRPTTTTLTDIPSVERVVTLTNGSPGVKVIDLTVNGTRFKVPGLKDGQSVTLDISSAMKSTDDNRIVITVHGPKRSTIDVLVWDGLSQLPT
jgi:hypothetical protein